MKMTTETGGSPRSSGTAEANDRPRLVDRTESSHSSASFVSSCISELDWELVESPAIARAGSPYDTIPLPEVEEESTENDHPATISLPATVPSRLERPLGPILEESWVEETEGQVMERDDSFDPSLGSQHLLWSVEGTMSSDVLQSAEFYRPELMIPCDNNDLEAPPPLLQASVRHRCIPLPDIDDPIEPETTDLLWSTSISAAPTPLVVTLPEEDEVAGFLGGSAMGAWVDLHVMGLTLTDLDISGDAHAVEWDMEGVDDGFEVVGAVDGTSDEGWVLLTDDE